MAFEMNRGQYDRQVRFASWGAGRNVLLTDFGAVITVSRTSNASQNSPTSGDLAQNPTLVQRHETAVVTMRAKGVNHAARIRGVDLLPGKANYLVGSNPASWRSDIPTYARVKYTRVYPGIDMAFYGKGGELEYDFIVAPRASPRNIRLKFSGIEGQSIDAEGNLILTTAVGQLIQHKPIAYQLDGRSNRDVECDFVMDKRGEIGFRLGQYNTGEPLTIDPQISYSAVLGGGVDDIGTSIAIDSMGNAYVAGYTYNFGFPIVGGLSGLPGGSEDAFVLKLDPTGSTLVYSTRLGGLGSDQANGIAVDSTGNAYIAGSTYSPNFPTVNAFQTNLGAEGQQDGFVAKLNPEGSALLYSTYLGGEGYDAAQSIAVDAVGSAYVAGLTQSTRFPVRNPLQSAKKGPLSNCFVSKFDAGGALVYSTYLGGSGGDSANGIAVDSQGDAYITGGAGSLDFPLLNPLQSSFQANTLLKSSDQGASWMPLETGSGRNSQVNGIAVDPHNPANVFIATYGGVFKSTDRGVSWASASNGLTEPSITAIAVDPVNSGTLYATAFGTAFKSTDSGVSWQTATKRTMLTSVAIDPFNSSNILLGDYYGICKSTDGGVTWHDSMFTFNSFGVTRIVADRKTPGVWYASVAPNIVAKSTSGGDFWVRVFQDSFSSAVTGIMEIDPVNPSTLYVGTDGGTISKSTDGGMTFPLKVQPTGALAGYVTAILVDPASPSTVYASFYTGGVYKTSDGGASWKPAGNLTNPYVSSIASALDGAGVLYLGTARISHAFITKLDSAGRSLAYSTYIGGEAGDVALSIAIDSSGNAYVAGSTSSRAFPQSNAFQPTINGGSDAFVCKVDQSGSRLMYSTYFGGDGNDAAYAVAVDSAGNATIGGITTSDDLPVLSPFQPLHSNGGLDAFIAQLDPAGRLRYSTYLGGTASDAIYGVATDAGGSVYVTGFTFSNDFPSTPGAVHVGSANLGAVFLGKVSHNPSQLAVTSARIDGKNMLIYGQNFAAGAALLLNGQQARARNDDLEPATLLFAKKLGRQIAPGQMATLQVRNPDGALSNILNFTRPAN